MKVTVSNNFSKGQHLLEDNNTSGIPRLKEIELINQSKKDIKKFKPLYEAYFHSILNYIYQKVLDQEIAADITSQVFLKAIANIRKYKIQAVPFSAWLYRIAYNETMMFFRKSKQQRTIVLDEELVNEIHEEIHDGTKEAVLNAIERLIKKLKPPELELIELRYYQGKSFREIGCILVCSENSAKVRLHRLIKKLKIELPTRDRHEKL